MRLLLKNIQTLVQVREPTSNPVRGKDMKNLPVLNDAWLAIENGFIADYGSMDDFPGIEDWTGLEILDCSGRIVFPSWVDSHTHIVYAGSREQEFVDRINGLTYEDIAKRGGGILNSADKLATASEEELFTSAMKRLQEMMELGTGAVEIKSGYGLSTEQELKMLRVIKRIREESEIPVRSTFLGAHAVARNTSYSEYVENVINEMIPAVADEKLAIFIDVFCETNYFTKEDSIRILEKGKEFGLIPKVHANQLNKSGGVQAGVAVGAISVDHLEFVDKEEIDTLLNSKTMPVVLPGAAFFLGLPLPPARKMIDAGLPLAVASDFNPGSSPSGNMNQMVSLLCVQYKLTPEEAINAATINAAFAMGIENESGSITRGKRANIFITKEIPSYSFLPYYFGTSVIDTTIINGKIKFRREL